MMAGLDRAAVLVFAADGRRFRLSDAFAGHHAAPANLSINSPSTGITIDNAGSASAHNNVQPTIIVDYILRVL